MNRIVVCAALKAELKAVLENTNITSGKKFLSGMMYSSDRFDILRTGMGKNSISSVVGPYISEHRPGLIIHLGTAGALIESLSVGEVFLVETYMFRERLIKPAWLEMFPGLPWPVSGLVTVDEAVTDPDRRSRLFLKSGMPLVDMEGFHIAEIVRNTGIPLLSLKVVSDRANRNAATDFNDGIDSLTVILKEQLELLLKHEDIRRYTGL